MHTYTLSFVPAFFSGNTPGWPGPPPKKKSLETVGAVFTSLLSLLLSKPLTVAKHSPLDLILSRSVNRSDAIHCVRGTDR